MKTIAFPVEARPRAVRRGTVAWRILVFLVAIRVAKGTGRWVSDDGHKGARSAAAAAAAKSSAVRSGGGHERRRRSSATNAPARWRHEPRPVFPNAVAATITDGVPALLARAESFFRDRLVPMAEDARERLVREVEDYRKRASRERTEKLERNKLWRETAENNSTFATKAMIAKALSSSSSASFSSPSSSYASSSLSESAREFNSSVLFRPPSLKMVFSPSRVLGLSLAAVLLAEVLERAGALFEDAPFDFNGFRYGLTEGLWQPLARSACAACRRARSRLEGWCYGYWYRYGYRVWRSLSEELRPARDAFLDAFLEYRKTSDGAAVLLFFLPTTKTAFAAGTACGMIAAPLLFSPAVARLWKPLAAVFALAEANHCCKARGKKLVQVLGETPHTLGATLDGVLDRCRALSRRGIRGMAECCRRAGPGRKTSGLVLAERRAGANDGESDAARGSSGGAATHTGSEKAKRRKATAAMRPRDGGGYSLGIRASRVCTPPAGRGRHEGPTDEHQLHPGRSPNRFGENNARTVESDRLGRRTMATKGFLTGCSIGLAMRGTNRN